MVRYKMLILFSDKRCFFFFGQFYYFNTFFFCSLHYSGSRSMPSSSSMVFVMVCPSAACRAAF